MWDVDAPPGSSCDGVAAFAPHSDYVSSLAWLDGGARLLSSSYDGTVRRLDVCSGARGGGALETDTQTHLVQADRMWRQTNML